MEGLRGVAVLMVFWVHFQSLFGGRIPAGSPVWNVAEWMKGIGQTGVDIFFVISGYLIYGAVMERAAPLSKFWRRRYQRIYPAFLAVFAIYLALNLWMPERSRLPSGSGNAAVYLLQNLLLMPGVFDVKPLITVAWSLSHEMLFYLTLPVVVLITGMRAWQSWERVTWTATGCVFFVAIIVGVRDLWWPSLLFTPLALIRTMLFLPGILCWEALHRGWRPPGGRLTAAALFAGYGAYSWLRVSCGNENECGDMGPLHLLARAAVLCSAYFPMAMECFGRVGTFARVLSWTPLRWLGNMSYSYYLSHSLALYGVASVGQTGVNSYLGYGVALGAGLGVSMVASTLLFSLVERPLSLGGYGRKKASHR